MTQRDYVDWKLTHSEKTAELTGYPLDLTNCKRRKLKEFQIFGNSVQDGTPTPDNPVDIQSVGDLVTDTTDANFGKYKIPYTLNTPNIADISTWISNGVVSKISDSEFMYLINGGLSNPIIANENTQYYISFEVKRVISQSAILTVYYTDRTYSVFTAQSGTYVSGEYTKVYGVSTSGKTISYLTLGGGGGLAYGTIFKNLQIVEGSTAPSTFTPAHTVTNYLYLDKPLRRIGAYSDKINFKKKQVIRQIYSKIFDGSESYYKTQSYANGTCDCFEYDISNSKYYLIADKWIIRYKSDRFISVTSFSSTNSVVGSIIGSNGSVGIKNTIVFNLQALSSMSATDFKTWMSEHNTEVQWILQTPIIENIGCEMPKATCNAISITIGTQTNPSSIYCKYII